MNTTSAINIIQILDKMEPQLALNKRMKQQCPDLSNIIFWQSYCIVSVVECNVIIVLLCVLSCWSATGTFAHTQQHLWPFILKNQASDGAQFSQRIILLAISAHQLATVRTFNSPTLVPGFLMNQDAVFLAARWQMDAIPRWEFLPHHHLPLWHSLPTISERGVCLVS